MVIDWARRDSVKMCRRILKSEICKTSGKKGLSYGHSGSKRLNSGHLINRPKGIQ
jgi:hypothetical protein